MGVERQEDFWLELAVLKDKYTQAFQDWVATPVRNDLLRIQARLQAELAALAGDQRQSDDLAAVANELEVVAHALRRLDAEIVRFYSLSLKDAPSFASSKAR
jgi:hypothetical protein